MWRGGCVDADEVRPGGGRPALGEAGFHPSQVVRHCLGGSGAFGGEHVADEVVEEIAIP